MVRLQLKLRTKLTIGFILLGIKSIKRLIYGTSKPNKWVIFEKYWTRCEYTIIKNWK